MTRSGLASTFRPFDALEPAALHRRLAEWNHRRLNPALPHDDWERELRADAEMRLLEGAAMERAREAAQPWLADMPTEPADFVG